MRLVFVCFLEEIEDTKKDISKLTDLQTKQTETEKKTFVTLLEHCTLCSSLVSIRKCPLFSTLQGGFQNNPAEKNLYALPREKQVINNGLQSSLKVFQRKYFEPST